MVDRRRDVGRARTDPPSGGRADELELISRGVLGALSDDVLEAIRSAMSTRSLAAGDVLVRQGETAEQLFVVLDGSLAFGLEETGQQLGQLGPGEVVGEVAVLSGTERTATARAATPARIGVIERQDLERIASTHPELVERLLDSSVRRVRHSQLAAFLAGLFGPMPAELIDALEARLTYRRVSGGEILFQSGDPGDAGYIVLSGRLRVTTIPSHGGPARVEEIGRRQPIGWAGLLTARPRNQTVVAIRDTEVARLTREAVSWFTTTVPQASGPIMAELADRMERAASAPAYSADRAATFAIIASPGVDASAFARRLEDSLAPHGRTMVIGPAVLSWIGGRVPPNHYLDEREAAHDFVVYVTDSTPTAWTDQCLRQADHIVVVADATSDPAPGPVERSLAGRWPHEGAPRRTLILLQQPEVEEPAGTAAWLEARRDGLEPDQHLHVRRHRGGPDAGIEMDLRSVGRILAGRGVTLVLGGGGARGYAHVGVVRAMEELGIPIDMVAGTSMGALVAAFVARRYSANRAEDAFVSLGRLLDVTLPLVSISSGARIERAISAAHGDRRIEDTWLPFFCISTNLTHARPVVHRHGSLRHALRASASLPGILPPVFEDGSLLIDGGLLDTLPVGVMRSLNGGGQVIAVDVSAPVDVAAGTAFADHLSGWRLLWQRLRHPRAPRTV
ncbi:MAG TPA: cyclic nucleotide-binding domain-containing protein, partial [Candidatus Limnocylindrales bacterium]|nr:cyclic nucleotide-binding domain-containing protein [Candidatus Limnocylindrales bacterium]